MKPQQWEFDIDEVLRKVNEGTPARHLPYRAYRTHENWRRKGWLQSESGKKYTKNTRQTDAYKQKEDRRYLRRKVDSNYLVKQRNRNRDRLWDQKLRIILNYGGKCRCCGETNPEFLSIDHIKGGGHKHRKIVGSRFYTFLEENNYPKKEFRLLCTNCNCSLGHYGYCPHSSKRPKVVK